MNFFKIFKKCLDCIEYFPENKTIVIKMIANVELELMLKELEDFTQLKQVLEEIVNGKKKIK